MYLKLNSLIAGLEVAVIPPDRKSTLQPLIDYIQHKVTAQQAVNLNFICTHNSRRSHLSQIWAQVMAAYFEIPMVYCYSGGTEATAMFPMVGETLKAQGFEVMALSEGKNPVYAIKYSDHAHPVIAFSKVYDHVFNPVSNFAAVLTCSQADAGCPFIAGAEVRIPITYEDPKAFDDTPQQADKYAERSVQIATELCYVFSKITKP
jgi:arsenate reductase